MAGGAASTGLLWEKEPDDFLHDPDPALDKAMDKQMRKWSIMALVNTVALCIVIIVLVGLFAGYVLSSNVSTDFVTNAPKLSQMAHLPLRDQGMLFAYIFS